ncbi:MAG: GNAT family N-acetyltransferase [Nanoarchaeota archaeon]|nr:GNAT family N-acetyltransferase [Nanoarchaeota archaeon]
MKIREYKEEDRKKVKKLVKEVLTEIFNSASNLKDLDNIKKEYKKFFVVEEKGEIIGTLGIKNEGDARISRMYIKKEKRGGGLGKKLVKKAIKLCKGKYKRIFLTTYPQMNSEGFYKKMGFKEYKRDERIWMELIL